MQLYLTIQGHVNFTQMARFGKPGKRTPGLSYFWSGCAGAMKRGLEILGIALVDGNSNDSFFLEAVHTFVDPLRGRKPKCTQGMKDPDSLIGLYLRTLAKRAKSLLGLSSIIVADAYFSKKSFADGVISLGFSLVSRFSDDVRQNYHYTGQLTGGDVRKSSAAGLTSRNLT